MHSKPKAMDKRHDQQHGLAGAERRCGVEKVHGQALIPSGGCAIRNRCSLQGPLGGPLERFTRFERKTHTGLKPLQSAGHDQPRCRRSVCRLSRSPGHGLREMGSVGWPRCPAHVGGRHGFSGARGRARGDPGPRRSRCLWLHEPSARASHLRSPSICRDRHGWAIDPAAVVATPGVVTGLAITARLLRRARRRNHHVHAGLSAVPHAPRHGWPPLRAGAARAGRPLDGRSIGTGSPQRSHRARSSSGSAIRTTPRARCLAAPIFSRWPISSSAMA